MAKKHSDTSSPKTSPSHTDQAMPFGRKNYLLLGLCVGLLAVGFITMASDSEPYGFGFLGITLGPILLMAGFVVGVAAILVKPSTDDSDA